MARTCSLKGREAFSQLSSRHNLSAICVCPGIRLPSNMASHCNSLFSSTPSQDGNVRLGAYCDRKLSTQSSVRVWSRAVAEHRGSSAEEHFRSLKNGSHCQCGVFPMSLRSSEMGERSFPLYPFCHFTLVSPFHHTNLSNCKSMPFWRLAHRILGFSYSNSISLLLNFFSRILT